MNKYTLLAFLLLFQLSFGVFAQTNSNGTNQKAWNASDIKLALKKLNTVGSVLYIAAHPDDENTRLLGYLSNERCLRTAYLSINRGDGGQNLIGTEQGDLLGLIRTEELLAARRIDGAEQYFTRANDFGYSKSPDESMRIWGHDSVLQDVVWIIRQFKPDVIITRFPTTGEGGHGHHTASAILAGEAFIRAVDPFIYKNLRFVEPWQPKRLYWNTFNFGNGTNTIDSNQLKLDVGVFNPMLGKGYGEIAAESRSMHKSQGFGVPRQRGSQMEYFKYIAGDSVKTDLFEGIDMTWKRVAGSEKVAVLLEQAYREFQPENPSLSIPILVKAYDEMQLLKSSYWKTQKNKELTDVIIACSGIWAEVVANDYAVSPGNKLVITANVINRSEAPFKLEQITFNGNYSNVMAKVDSNLSRNKLMVIKDSMIIKSDETYSTPYWLRKKHRMGMYDVEDNSIAPTTNIGMPENKAAISANIRFTYGKDTFSISRPVVYKWTDPVDGEKYRPLEIGPPVTSNIEFSKYMFTSNQTKEMKVVVKSNGNDESGTIKLQLSNSDWKVEPASIPFNLKKKGDEMNAVFSITSAKTGNEAVTAKAVIDINNSSISKNVTRINYPHIPIQTLFSDAEAKLVPIEIQKKGMNIGYIIGAGDEIPQCLRQIGYNVSTLSDEMLTNQSLNSYDAIVVGIRAYNTNERMSVYYKKLMDYISNGGNLIVQYNTNNNLATMKGDIGPYPFKISRDRVTVEEAPMTFDMPAHPILNTPNKITQSDFDNWIQERGIYFATDIDAKYDTIFSCNDPGEKPLKGSTIVTKYDKGYFIYTGLAFFRQLPAGVPGAYRLFANMISIGK
ncbi:MAG: PIG-L family deacetylase [Bacteroidota bacterium]